MIELVAATTAGGTSAPVIIKTTNRRIPATVLCTGLAGAETCDLQISYDGGTTFTNIIINGTQQQMTATNNILTIEAPGIYRVVQSASVGSATTVLITDIDL